MRPWTDKEIPRIFMVRRIDDEDDPDADTTSVCRSGVVNLVLITGFDKIYQITPAKLFEEWLHIHEDGSATPCGAEDFS